MDVTNLAQRHTRLFNQVEAAQGILKGVATQTPLLRNDNLSDLYEADIYFKREDLQPVRSYKLRGAYCKLFSLSPEERKRGIVCASAGNHAQGVAWSCRRLGIHGRIFMPATTPAQKVRQVAFFGKEWIEIILRGDTFDDAFLESKLEAEREGLPFIHPFDDDWIIAGQGTCALEVLKDAPKPVDILLVPIGGGGLAAGMSTVFRKRSPHTRIFGVEPAGAPSMSTSINNGRNTTLEKMDRFVDGAAVRRVGDRTFEICRKNLDDVLLVAEGRVCTTLLKLYNEEAMVLEPAGALTVAVLDQCRELIRGKQVVCVISGSNNDITRTEEIRERSLLHEGLKHYFIIRFPQRAGALREFLNEVLGSRDDITFFQFVKKNNRESAPAIVGLELNTPDDKRILMEKMKKKGIVCEYINEKPELFEYLI
jgi:threonine dehydratase